MLSRIATCGESRTKPTLVSRKAAFGLGALAILPTRESIVHHPSILAFRWPRCIAWVDRNCGATNAKLLTTQRMIMLRVVRFVGQHTPQLKIVRRLTHRWRKVGRVLARTLSGNGAHNQLTGGMKDSRQFRPRSVSAVRTSAAPLKMDRCMASFQSCSIDGCCVVSVINDQATSSASVAAAGKKFCKVFFSRSFCSTCHSVE